MTLPSITVQGEKYLSKRVRIRQLGLKYVCLPWVAIETHEESNYLKFWNVKTRAIVDYFIDEFDKISALLLNSPFFLYL